MSLGRMGPRRLAAALLAAALLCLCGCTGGGSIRAVDPTPEPSAPAPTLEPLPERGEELRVPVYCDGLLSDWGCLRDETVYLDPALLCGILGTTLDVDADGESLSLRIDSLSVTGVAGTGYLLAGERFLYAPGGWILAEDRVFLPADAVGRLFGVQIRCGGDPLRAELDTSGAALMDGSGTFYLRQCSDEDFYWLVHVIAAEAGNQGLAGQIGVGNVVMNRVRDELFPGTIKEVVFQKGERAMFTPVESGDIHMMSDRLSLIAAYLVLEGVNTVGDSLYFVNPEVGDDTWLEANRTFVVRIGDHDFYA